LAETRLHGFADALQLSFQPPVGFEMEKYGVGSGASTKPSFPGLPIFSKEENN
jgi:hypothetical protein